MHIWIAAALGTVLAIVLLFLAGAWVLAYWATHPIRIPLPGSVPEDLQPCESVEFASVDGVRLSGWFMPRPHAQATVILCHGHQFNRSQMIGIVRMLRDEPLQFLLFDFRRAGASGGSVSTIGWLEREDVRAAVDWLWRDPRTAGRPIGVFGLSMGGAAAILAAAEDPRIAAVATHGAYATLYSAIDRRCRFLVGVFGPMLAAPTLRIGRRWLPCDPSQVAPSQVIAKIAPRPVLLLHGRLDPFVDVRDARTLYDAAREPRRLVVLEHSWHVTVSQADETRYASEIRAFFTKSLYPSADLATAQSLRKDTP